MLSNEIICKSHPKGNVVFTCCDDLYFNKFFDRLFLSFKEKVRSFDAIHVHVINPSGATKEKIISISGPSLTISYEYFNEFVGADNLYSKYLSGISDLSIKKMIVSERFRKQHFIINYVVGKIMNCLSWRCFLSNNSTSLLLNKTFYSVRRFCLGGLLANTENCLIVDIDSIFSKDFPLSQIPVEEGVCYAQARVGAGWSRYMAGIVLVKFDDGFSSAYDKMTSFFENEIERSRFHWGIDQLSLDYLGALGMLRPFPLEVMSFDADANHDSVFISDKGDEKWKV